MRSEHSCMGEEWLSDMAFNLGLIINPLAGIGGGVGLKGSDGADTVSRALALGALQRAPERCKRALESIMQYSDSINVLAFAGAMGADVAAELGFKVEIVGTPQLAVSSPEDTQRAAKILKSRGVDLILFAGGDGTARDICAAVGLNQPVLGVPAGVKMHSGVYAVSPEAAGEVLQLLMCGDAVPLRDQEVRDIDEAEFRGGRVRAKYYGEMRVPEAEQFVQQVKNSGRVPEPLEQADIAATVIEQILEDELYIVGPGSTTLAVMAEMGLSGTLLGVDLVCNQQLLAADVGSADIIAALAKHDGSVRILVTAIGGQGHIIGRGNQQISAEILHKVGRSGLSIIATPSKIEELNGRPLLIDSNDAVLDRAWSGFCSVIVGYNEVVLYPLGLGSKH